MMINSVSSLKHLHTCCLITAVFAATGPARAASEKVLYSFKYGSDGANPQAGLTQVGGTLFGTTSRGGTDNFGTVFKVTKAGTETVVYAFKGIDGIDPVGSLINVHGTLFGTTDGGGGGQNNSGTVFKVTRAGAETTVYSFQVDGNWEIDGANPLAALIEVDGKFYGTTYDGGTLGFGTVFKVTKAGTETVLHSFEGHDGAHPYGGLIAVGDALYGTTNSGPVGGTVFKMTKSGAETVLHSFGQGSDGSGPEGAMIDVDGMLYGSTLGGGASNEGAVFKITKEGAETVVYSFKGGSDGEEPEGGLINIGGTLYGATQYGGGSANCSYGCGTVFKVTKSGAETVLYSFKGAGDGASPQGTLINIGNKLYGTTVQGGAGDYGTVFVVTP